MTPVAACLLVSMFAATARLVTTGLPDPPPMPNQISTAKLDKFTSAAVANHAMANDFNLAGGVSRTKQYSVKNQDGLRNDHQIDQDQFELDLHLEGTTPIINLQEKFKQESSEFEECLSTKEVKKKKGEIMEGRRTESEKMITSERREFNTTTEPWGPAQANQIRSQQQMLAARESTFIIMKEESK